MTKFIDITKKIEEGKGKETVFTHYYNNQRGWVRTASTSLGDDCNKVVYLGHCESDGDMFCTYYEDGGIEICKGIKGDEF